MVNKQLKEITYEELYNTLNEFHNMQIPAPDNKLQLKWFHNHPYAKDGLITYASVDKSEYERGDIVVRIRDQGKLNFDSYFGFSIIDYKEFKDNKIVDTNIKRMRVLYITDFTEPIWPDGYSFWVKEFDLNDIIGKLDDLIKVSTETFVHVNKYSTLLYGLYWTLCSKIEWNKTRLKLKEEHDKKMKLTNTIDKIMKDPDKWKELYNQLMNKDGE